MGVGVLGFGLARTWLVAVDELLEVHAEAGAGVGAVDGEEEVLAVLEAQDEDVVQQVLTGVQVLRGGSQGRRASRERGPSRLWEET